MRLPRAIGGLLAVLLGAGCTAVQPEPRQQPQQEAQQEARHSADGCKGAKLESGRHTMRFGGLERVYLLRVPKGRGPHPVLLDLHGLGSTAARQAAYSRLPEVGAARGYIVATPQAAEGRLGWTLPHTYGPDDTAFLAALLDHLEGGLCADRGREFAAGMSYGAGMAAALVCGLAGRLAGVAPVAGINIVEPCKEAKPTVIVAFHGDADRIVPYRGGHPFRDASGRLRGLADMIVLPPVARVVDGWATVLGCTKSRNISLSSDVRRSSWRNCAPGAALTLYTIRGGGHTWPGPIAVSSLGATTRDLDATRVILDAFDAAPPR
ncbi:alpha/beta hydrolase family esterase [Nonomuraea sp. NPDC050536]|uniref:alpha/beta hydrolase family esterase n=1 Tax=Nonomuraea sp. NPDC050536 TaxID=3364366 RepID=UPI0037C757CC